MKLPWPGSDRASRLPLDWPRRRRDVLRRDGDLCQLDGPGCTVLATEVDHVRPGDDHALSNLQALCSPCHKAKTIAERPRPRTLKRPPERHPGLRR